MSSKRGIFWLFWMKWKNGHGIGRLSGGLYLRMGGQILCVWSQWQEEEPWCEHPLQEPQHPPLFWLRTIPRTASTNNTATTTITKISPKLIWTAPLFPFPPLFSLNDASEVGRCTAQRKTLQEYVRMGNVCFLAEHSLCLMLLLHHCLMEWTSGD